MTSIKKTGLGARGFLLFALRVLIGWHFLYEGLAKLWTPGWTAVGFLSVSRWWFADFFHWIASDPTLMRLSDSIVIWALIATGLCLILGCFTRAACAVGAGLLAMFYVCNPPLVGLSIPVPSEGNYLVVDKNLVELAALAVLFAFRAGRHGGVDAIVAAWLGARSAADGETTDDPSRRTRLADRRAWLRGLAGLPVLALFGYAIRKKRQWQSYEEANLVDAKSGASTKALRFDGLSQLNGQLPKAKIKDRVFSRMILGGNLLSGWAHSRDLIYVSSLVKAYHTKQKIFETLLLAEKCGVNTLLTNPILCTLIDEYWKRGIGEIQFISDCAGLDYTDGVRAIAFDDYLDKIRRAIDYGACACYIQGETADHYIEKGHQDRLAAAVQLIRDAKLPVGIGAHRIETIKACVDAGLDPDFWMKTLHHHNYWSARHPEWKDNMYCYSPEETIAYMETLPQPWIAFKVLAAGAIRPSEGLRYAFANGADFACVGMYDFQMVENINAALEVLVSELPRKRPWRSETLPV